MGVSLVASSQAKDDIGRCLGYILKDYMQWRVSICLFLLSSEHAVLYPTFWYCPSEPRSDRDVEKRRSYCWALFCLFLKLVEKKMFVTSLQSWVCFCNSSRTGLLHDYHMNASTPFAALSTCYLVAPIAYPTCENNHDQITLFGRRITHPDPTPNLVPLLSNVEKR